MAAAGLPVPGSLSTAFQMMLVSGILYTYIVGAIVHSRKLPIFCGPFNLVSLAAFFRAPETPTYFLKKDKPQKAESSLRVLRGQNYNVQKELQSVGKNLSSGNTKLSFGQEIKKKSNIKAMIICLGLMTFQQLVGVNIVIFYAEKIFESAGTSISPAVCTILVGLAQLIAVIGSSFLIEKVGRKFLLQISAIIMALCLGTLGFYFFLKDLDIDVSKANSVPLVAIVIYMILFGLGFGPIPWMMSSEILPADIKGIGTGIAAATNWFLAFTTTKIFVTLIEILKDSGTYWLLSIICGLAFLFVKFLVIETKGKSTSLIQVELGSQR